MCFLAAFWAGVCSGIDPPMIRFKRRKIRFAINRVPDKDYTIHQMWPENKPLLHWQAKNRLICDKSNSSWSQTLIWGHLWLNITSMFCTDELRLVQPKISLKVIKQVNKQISCEFTDRIMKFRTVLQKMCCHLFAKMFKKIFLNNNIYIFYINSKYF